MGPSTLGARRLAILGSATSAPTAFAAIVCRSMVQRHDLDLQIARAGADYVLLVHELAGCVVTFERTFSICLGALDESQRMTVLAIYIEQVLTKHRRPARSKVGAT